MTKFCKDCKHLRMIGPFGLPFFREAYCQTGMHTDPVTGAVTPVLQNAHYERRAHYSWSCSPEGKRFERAPYDPNNDPNPPT